MACVLLKVCVFGLGIQSFFFLIQPVISVFSLRSDLGPVLHSVCVPRFYLIKSFRPIPVPYHPFQAFPVPSHLRSVPHVISSPSPLPRSFVPYHSAFHFAPISHFICTPIPPVPLYICSSFHLFPNLSVPSFLIALFPMFPIYRFPVPSFLIPSVSLVPHPIFSLFPIYPSSFAPHSIRSAPSPFNPFPSLPICSVPSFLIPPFPCSTVA